MPTTKLKVWDKPNRYGSLRRKSISKGKKMVASMSRNRICMELIRQVNIHPTRFIFFPLGAGREAGRKDGIF
jgi:hypothetical protein